MRHGDISNQVAPRILLIAEGALIYLSDAKRWEKIQKKGDYHNIEKCWTVHDLMARRILWLFHKKDLRIDLVTFLGDEFAEELADWLEQQIPLAIGDVWSTGVNQLQRTIDYMPDLAMVYDPEPARWATWGSKGMFISDVNQLGAF